MCLLQNKNFCSDIDEIFEDMYNNVEIKLFCLIQRKISSRNYYLIIKTV